MELAKIFAAAAQKSADLETMCGHQPRTTRSWSSGRCIRTT
jgi:hypothetical protein